MQSPEVKQTTVKTVADVYSTVIVKGFYDLFKKLNRVGARTQPRFTMGKDPKRSLFNLTWPHLSLCSWITILRNFGGGNQGAPWSSTITFCSLCQTFWSGPQTLHTVLCSAPCISLGSCLRTNTMSVVPRWLWTHTGFLADPIYQPLRSGRIWHKVKF